jgi:hypothetical protein
MPVDSSVSPPVLARLVCEEWPAHGFAGFEGRQDVQGERFFYLSWSSRTIHGRDRFRRAKIQLRELTSDQLSGLMKRGGTITARVSALARDGGPACATVPLLGGGWTTS